MTVDGPSGTGKSTVSREVARRADLPHLDTGAYYRAATLAALRSGATLDSEAEVIDAIARAQITEKRGQVYLDDEDVSDEIRGEKVTAHVSQVSAYPRVRRLLVERQRDWVDRHDRRAVVEGRDIGSVVFPDAQLKIYLDADPEIRARRRAQQMGQDPDAVIADLKRRDEFDSKREASPLTIPPGSRVIDTTDLSFDEVVAKILDLVDEHS